MGILRLVLAVGAAAATYLGLVRGSSLDPALLSQGVTAAGALQGVASVVLAGLAGAALPGLLEGGDDPGELPVAPPVLDAPDSEGVTAHFFLPTPEDLGLVEEGPPDESEGQTITRALKGDEQIQMSKGLVEEAAWDKAVPFFARAVKLNAANKKAISLLCCEAGQRFYEEGRLEDAAGGLAIAVQYEPSLAPAHTLLAHTLVRLGEVPRATEHFLEACALEPEDYHHFFNLGVFYEKTGRIDDAVLAFERVVALKPASLDAHYFLARMRMTFADHARARAHLEECVRLSAESPQGEWAARTLDEIGDAG